MKSTIHIAVRLEPTAKVYRFKGREAWALAALIDAGEKGCTPIEHVGPRWSAYVHKLRKAGLIIETIHESHSGPYSGRHGRYALRTALSVVARFDDKPRGGKGAS